MNDFNKWLLDELNQRGWTATELSRKSGLAAGTLSNVLNDARKPGPDVCLAIAEALNEPPERIYRLAGLLPPLPAPEDSLSVQEVIDITKRLDTEKRERLVKIAKLFLEEQNKQAPTVKQPITQ